jgi:hypothetical protein
VAPPQPKKMALNRHRIAGNMQRNLTSYQNGVSLYLLVGGAAGDRISRKSSFYTEALADKYCILPRAKCNMSADPGRNLNDPKRRYGFGAVLSPRTAWKHYFSFEISDAGEQLSDL